MNTTAEFLRKLADLIDLADTNQAAIVAPTPAPVAKETEVMVPPLQQKIELLKKIAGVDSVYDEESIETQTDESSEDNSSEEIKTLQRNAGLAVALDDDFPEE